jgi:hypothetical protein
MVHLLNLKHYLSCKRQVKDLASDPEFAGMIKAWFDDHPDMREELPDIYVLAVRTIEKTQKP